MLDGVLQAENSGFFGEIYDESKKHEHANTVKRSVPSPQPAEADLDPIFFETL
jgi:hypothetical protein